MPARADERLAAAQVDLQAGRLVDQLRVERVEQGQRVAFVMQGDHGARGQQRGAAPHDRLGRFHRFLQVLDGDLVVGDLAVKLAEPPVGERPQLAAVLRCAPPVRKS